MNKLTKLIIKHNIKYIFLLIVVAAFDLDLTSNVGVLYLQKCEIYESFQLLLDCWITKTTKKLVFELVTFNSFICH